MRQYKSVLALAPTSSVSKVSPWPAVPLKDQKWVSEEEVRRPRPAPVMRPAGSCTWTSGVAVAMEPLPGCTVVKPGNCATVKWRMKLAGRLLP